MPFLTTQRNHLLLGCNWFHYSALGTRLRIRVTRTQELRSVQKGFRERCFHGGRRFRRRAGRRIRVCSLGHVRDQTDSRDNILQNSRHKCTAGQRRFWGFQLISRSTAPTFRSPSSIAQNGDGYNATQVIPVYQKKPEEFPGTTLVILDLAVTGTNHREPINRPGAPGGLGLGKIDGFRLGSCL